MCEHQSSHSCVRIEIEVESGLDTALLGDIEWFVLPYLELLGGAIAIAARQYLAVNGMSNAYFGWGGEEDDLYARLKAHHFIPWRFEPKTSIYHMIYHEIQGKGAKGHYPHIYAGEKMYVDGLSTLEYTEVVTVLHPLFTHIVVEL